MAILTGLTDRQEAFVRLVLAGSGLAEAYRAAGYEAKFPARDASKLLRSPAIKKAIDRAKKQAAGEGKKVGVEAVVAEKEAERAQIAAETASKVLTAQQVLEHLSDIAAGRVDDVTTNKDGEVSTCPPRIADRIRALELIGKRHKLWVEKVETTHKGLSFADLVLEGERRRAARKAKQ